MAGKSDIEAGAAHVRIYVKRNDLTRGLAATKKDLQSFRGVLMTAGKTPFGERINKGLSSISTKITDVSKDIQSAMGPLLGISAAIVGGFVAIGATIFAVARAGSQFASQLDDIAQRLGIAAREAAVFSTAATLAGASIEDVEKGIKELSKKSLDPKAMREIANDLEKAGASGAFDPTDFESAAKSIASIEDPQKRVAIATKIWGKAGEKLIPIFSELAKLNDGGAGLIPTKEAIKAGAEIDDEFASLGMAWKNFMLEATHAMKPWLQGFLRGTTDILRAMSGIANAIGRWANGLRMVGSHVAGIDTKFAALLLKVARTGEMETAWQISLLEMSKKFDEFIIHVIEGFQKAALFGAAVGFGNGKIDELKAQIEEARKQQHALMAQAEQIYRGRQAVDKKKSGYGMPSGPGAVDVSFSGAALAAMGSGAGMIAQKKDPALELIKKQNAMIDELKKHGVLFAEQVKALQALLAKKGLTFGA